jgi:YfiH family protein
VDSAAGFNLAHPEGLILPEVQKNRSKLIRELGLSQAPQWLSQVHGTNLLRLPNQGELSTADGAITSEVNCACAILTADCLPILLTDQQGRQVAAIHAGWRGLAAGIVQRAIACFSQPKQVLVWLGPAIGAQAFVVGSDVLAAFLALDADLQHCFRPCPGSSGKWLADIYGLARHQLQSLGVTQVYGGDYCTYTDSKRFFSYRRDATYGRMASLIWIR